jgi:hypothetical protein
MKAPELFVKVLRRTTIRPLASSTYGPPATPLKPSDERVGRVVRQDAVIDGDGGLAHTDGAAVAGNEVSIDRERAASILKGGPANGAVHACVGEEMPRHAPGVENDAVCTAPIHGSSRRDQLLARQRFGHRIASAVEGGVPAMTRHRAMILPLLGHRSRDGWV